MSVSTASTTLELYYSAAWHTVASGSVLGVSGSWEISGNRNNGVAFGDDTDASLDARFVYSVWSALAYHQPIRYTTTNSADGTTRTFTGVVTKMHRTTVDCDVSAAGIKELIAATKVYSPPINRRAVATKTTASSADDPTNPAWSAGLINYLLWQAGGRPYEQAASYPSAVFYYSCDHAIVAPEWSWAAGEDAWSECLTMARAAGGQMYQDASGVVRYKQVLGYAGASATDSLTESSYATIEETTDPDILQGNKFTCQYLPRRRLGTQQIADDTTPRAVEPGETITITLEPQNPLASLEQASAGQLKSDALVIARQDGSRVGTGQYSHTLDFKAARVVITVTNTDTRAFHVWRVVLRGDPIVATEAGSVSSGSGTERQIEPSPYIQSQADAERLAQMYAAFYGAARPTVSIGGCVHKPSRYVGQTIALTCAAWSLVAVSYVILKISHEDGTKADYEIAYVGDLPDSSQFFICGTSYSGSDVRYLGW